jgi:hypothetical protein
MPGAQPQVINLGGPVLKAPKVQPIAYMSDPDLKDLEGALQELAQGSGATNSDGGTSDGGGVDGGSPEGGSPEGGSADGGIDYWTQVTSEYGVGPLTVLPTIVLNQTAPSSLTGSDIEQMLSNNLTGTMPAWGAADASTIYLFLFPPGTVVSDQGTCCKEFDGFHYEVTVGPTTVPYAITCACAGFDGPGVTPIQQRTVVVSHETVESATDPFVNSNPAYAQADDADYVWSLVTGGEVADMCSYNLDSFYRPPGATYTVQRSWSDAAAKKLANPCVPVPAVAAFYYNSFPALPDMVHFDQGFGSTATRGVKIPVGQTRTIPVHLWSSTPNKTWTVTAYDYEAFATGGSPNLKLSLDKSSGVSGETLMLSITVLSADPTFGAEAFILTSDLANGTETLSMGLVGQQ